MVSVINVVQVRECAILSLSRAKNAHQPVCVFRWTWPQYKRIKRSKDRRVYTDPKRQGQNRRHGEARAFADHAQAEAQILDKPVDQVDASRLAALFFGALDPAKLDARTPQRFLSRHAAAHQILGERLDMEAQLRI